MFPLQLDGMKWIHFPKLVWFSFFSISLEWNRWEKWTDNLLCTSISCYVCNVNQQYVCKCLLFQTTKVIFKQMWQYPAVHLSLWASQAGSIQILIVLIPTSVLVYQWKHNWIYSLVCFSLLSSERSCCSSENRHVCANTTLLMLVLFAPSSPPCSHVTQRHWAEPGRLTWVRKRNMA